MKKLISLLLCVLFIVSNVTVFAASPSDLKYSTYVSTPANYNSQNCYGYVLGRAVAVDPGYYSGNTGSFQARIIADLNALGYDAWTTTNANITLASGQSILSFFTGTWRTAPLAPSGDFGEMNGYHFWVRRNNLSSKSIWLHKYARQSGIMDFNYLPTAGNKAYVCDEYYNGITNFYNLGMFFPVSGTWGFIVFSPSSSSSPNSFSLSIAETDPAATSGELDHSAGAMAERILAEMGR